MGMRALIQRVSRGRVTVAEQVLGAIGQGYVVLLGVGQRDVPEDAEWLADRVIDLRLFADQNGKTNLSLADISGEVLVVSQFTLYANANRGRRPSFTDSAPPALAEPLYERFIAHLRARGARVATGRFGAQMQVDILNDGPVTIWLEREAGRSLGGG